MCFSVSLICFRLDLLRGGGAGIEQGESKECREQRTQKSPPRGRPVSDTLPMSLIAWSSISMRRLQQEILAVA